jgi:hypothetical protein
MKSLPCGLLLCQGCSELWQCECGLCGDRKRDTLVPREGVCGACLKSTLLKTDKLCQKCTAEETKQIDSVSIWDLFWNVGSRLTCGAFSGVVLEEPKQVDHHVTRTEMQIWPIKYSKPSGMTNFKSNEKSDAGDEKKTSPIF